MSIHHDITLPQAIAHMQQIARGGKVQADFADDLDVILSALELQTALLADCKAQLDEARGVRA